MRQSREAAAQTRRKIVKTAARAWRRDGLDGIGIAGLMAEAGLTHGGFYKHFASRDAAIAEALAHAVEETRAARAALVAKAPPGEALKVFIDSYLSEAHLDRPERGCVLAAIGAEAGRAAPEIRQVLADGYERFAASAAPLLGGDEETRLPRARVLAGALVGVLTMARTLTGRAAAREVLARAREDLLAAYGAPS